MTTNNFMSYKIPWINLFYFYHLSNNTLNSSDYTAMNKSMKQKYEFKRTGTKSVMI